jgi:CheY-like chemotaxis protein
MEGLFFLLIFMKSALHILLLEDSTLDTTLIERELREATIPFRLTKIESESQLRRELIIDKPDLVLSDHHLPSFDGFAALKIVRQEHPQLPFIFVSGSNDEQMILDMFERGATDYVFKRDLGDLRRAVIRALGNWRESTPGESQPIGTLVKSNPMVTGYLVICPGCLKIWDENGQPARLEEYLSSHTESFVTRQVCLQCGNARRAN